MKILIMGTGRMGTWLTEEFCLNHTVGVFDTNREKLKHFIEVERFTDLSAVRGFQPDMVINAVSLSATKDAFNAVLPFLSNHCMLADITSVKGDLKNYYKEAKHPFVSLHPMFGPTFSNTRNLEEENAIIISESCPEGKDFFRELFEKLNLRIFEHSFQEHDECISYSLSVPFASSLVFAACMQPQEAPGNTFKKHLQIAKGLLSQDESLVTEVLLNPRTLSQIEAVANRLAFLTHIIKEKDSDELGVFLKKLKTNMAECEAIMEPRK